MAMSRAYLDYNASAPLRNEVREDMLEALGFPGNASSVHGEGRQLRGMVEQARTKVANLINADPAGVIFTSGATEAAYLGLTPHISLNGKSRPAERLLVLETEHPCVLAGGQFSPDQIDLIPVLQNGLVDLQALHTLLAAHDDKVVMVAVQLANSETGVIQPVAEVAQLVSLHAGYTFCDAVQAAGKIIVDVGDLGVDFLALSAHKIGGPQGVGALVLSHGSLAISPAIRGGSQESNRRGGTENVAAITGFGTAAHLAAKEVADSDSLSALRDSLEQRLIPICAQNGMSSEFRLFGTDVERLPNTSLMGLGNWKAETALIAFDLQGIAVSSGSACSSAKVAPSHVLKAMGVSDELAKGAIRVSLGWNSSQREIDQYVVAFAELTKRLCKGRKNENQNGSPVLSGAVGH